jgi:Domain of unknown function (DUF4928)
MLCEQMEAGGGGLNRKPVMSESKRPLEAMQEWYEALPRPKNAGGMPAKGSLAVGLVLLERLKSSFELDLSSHLAPGGAQIQGVSGAAVRKILKRFGETRRFVGEGGRTNRGTPTIAGNLLQAIDSAGLSELSEEERAEVLEELQRFLVGKVQEFHSRERLKPGFDPARSTRQFISDLLALADETGRRGPVAQYLVGAKLQLRFPDIEIRNESYSAADDPSGSTGDFVVGDTTFHVTVAPMPGHFEKSERNLQDGHKVYILVPDEFVIGARQNAELTAEGRIAVESIESFVSQNIEEISNFSKNEVAQGLLALLEKYNDRIDAIEVDKSMMVEIPPNLR